MRTKRRLFADLAKAFLFDKDGGKDDVKVFGVMDELMVAVAALNKNLYESTIEKIKAV